MHRRRWNFFDEGEAKEVPLNDQFLPMIKNIRSTVCLFRNSPLKNKYLQKYVQNEFGISLNLILDCKTRWNSLSDMLERFLKLKDCVMKALIDLKVKSTLDEIDFQQL